MSPPRTSGEALRAERVLATARVFLAASALVAVYLDPTQPTQYARLAYALFAAYLLHSLALFALLGRRHEVKPSFQRWVHGVDVLWPAVITFFTEGPNSPFFVLFAFALVAAAYRWGFRETVITAVVGTALVISQALVATLGGGPMQLLSGEFELNRLIMRSTYLLMMGALLGYLAEQGKQLRAETAAVARVLARAQGETGLKATLLSALREVLRLFDAPRALLALQEKGGDRSFLWEGRREGPAQDTRLAYSELDASDAQRLLDPCAAKAWHAERAWRRVSTSPVRLLALDGEGRRIRCDERIQPLDLLERCGCSSLLCVSFCVGNEWSGRLLVLDPRVGAHVEPELCFLQLLVKQVSPAVYSAYLSSRLRRQAGVMERARVARELHDGTIQSLIAVEMNVEVLKRRFVDGQTELEAELSRLQKLLRETVLNLRVLMEGMKPLELHPAELPDFLADAVERFRRETGISARFVSEREEVTLPARVCRELARIVQEALVNIRKHSEARNALVRLSSQNGCWKLVIDDDGRGFAFSGRLRQAELDARRRGPLVIKERVRAIGGELMVESIPGQGSRLEITLPGRGPWSERRGSSAS